MILFASSELSFPLTPSLHLQYTPRAPEAHYGSCFVGLDILPPILTRLAFA